MQRSITLIRARVALFSSWCYLSIYILDVIGSEPYTSLQKGDCVGIRASDKKNKRERERESWALVFKKNITHTRPQVTGSADEVKPTVIYIDCSSSYSSHIIPFYLPPIIVLGVWKSVSFIGYLSVPDQRALFLLISVYTSPLSIDM